MSIYNRITEWDRFDRCLTDGEHFALCPDCGVSVCVFCDDACPECQEPVF